MSLKCGRCGDGCNVAREELLEEVVVSDCCRADVYLGGMIYSFWDYDQNERAAHADDLREMRRDDEMMQEMEKCGHELFS